VPATRCCGACAAAQPRRAATDAKRHRTFAAGVVF
jgi:hypothetical protein